VGLRLRNASLLFDYEISELEKVKRALHPESESDASFFKGLVIQLRFRQSFLDAGMVSETQKLKLLKHFTGVLASQRRLAFVDVINQIERVE
jgi:hypothetical protein